jgi:two-component system cell cycle sensor histidine kinase/response regulator CckA
MEGQARILIVDDERLIARDLRQQVQRLGHVVVGLAATGPEAVRQAVTDRPDVVLTDIGMRGQMDGIEAAGHIRARLPIPVVYISADLDAQTLRRAQATAPAGYLQKPVTEEALQQALAPVMRAAVTDSEP